MMVNDEPALWASIPDRLKPNVEAAAKAICRMATNEYSHAMCCIDANDGTCVAFGLYGNEAFAAAKAIDDLQMERLHAGIFGDKI